MPSAHRISLRPPPPLPPSPPQEQFQGEREGLLDDYRILTQQIKLKNLIIACFIPPDYQDKIMQHCHWQDYEGAWNIDFLPYAGRSWLLPWAVILFAGIAPGIALSAAGNTTQVVPRPLHDYWLNPPAPLLVSQVTQSALTRIWRDQTMAPEPTARTRSWPTCTSRTAP